jgi:hypothetical protein
MVERSFIERSYSKPICGPRRAVVINRSRQSRLSSEPPSREKQLSSPASPQTVDFSKHILLLFVYDYSPEDQPSSCNVPLTQERLKKRTS